MLLPQYLCKTPTSQWTQIQIAMSDKDNAEIDYRTDEGLLESTSRSDAEVVSTAVEEVLVHCDSVETVVKDLRQRSLEGESVQSELEEMFEADTRLSFLAVLDEEDRLQEGLDLAEEGNLDESTREDFDEFWRSVAWCTPAVEPLFNDVPWTSATIDIERANHQPMVNHVFERGIDSIHDIEVPAGQFLTDAAGRTMFTVEEIAENHVDALDESDVARFMAAVSVFEKVSSAIRELVANTEIDEEQLFDDEKKGELDETLSKLSVNGSESEQEDSTAKQSQEPRMFQ